MYKHNFDKTILRSYDIRGIYEKTLNNKEHWGHTTQNHPRKKKLNFETKRTPGAHHTQPSPTRK